MSGKDAECGKENGHGVCRDFLRNACARGQKCKFAHVDPSSGAANESKKEEGGMQDKVVFCKDFQNVGCRRANCRFLHIGRDEEKEYRQRGYLPPHVRDQVSKRPLFRLEGYFLSSMRRSDPYFYPFSYPK